MSTEIKEYTQTEAALSELRSRYAGVIWNVGTTKGMDEAKKARADVRGYRVDLEKVRQEIKAPALKYCRLIDDEAKRITAELVALEEPIDTVIKAEEARKAAEKAERERIEAERVAIMRGEINGMLTRASHFVAQSASRIAEELSDMRNRHIDLDEFAELTGEAQQARNTAIEQLEALHAAAVAREAEAARLEAERLKAEEERRIEAEKLAAERAELERQQAAMRAEQAAIRAQREAMETEQRKAAEIERARLADLERAKAEAERKAQEAEAARLAEIKKQEEASNVVELPKKTRPTDEEIIAVVSQHYRVHKLIAIKWLMEMDLESASERESGVL